MLTINDHTLQLANISEQQLLLEIALMLYQKGKLTFGQAAQTANISYTEFQFQLGKNKIAINYSVQDVQDDAITIQNFANGNY
jgi:predicted HTH domain antitoxin